MKIKAIVVVGLPLLALLFGLILLESIVQREDQAAGSVRHTLEVRQVIASISSDMLAAQSAGRGFTLMRKPEYLKPLEAARHRAMRSLDRLTTLVSDNPKQTEQAHLLKTEADRQFANLDQLVAEVRASPPVVNPAVARTQEASLPLENVLATMDAEELELLAIRNRELRRQRNVALFTGLGTFGLGLLGGIAGALLAARSVGARLVRLAGNARALRLEVPLIPTPPARDEIGEVETELERTSRLIAERSIKLHQSLEELHAVVDNTLAMVFMKDLESRFLVVNRRCAEILGRSQEELIGLGPEDLFPPELAALVRAQDREVLEGRKPMEFEDRGVRKGKEMVFLAAKVPLFDKHGEPYGLCGVATDITERKRWEAELEARVAERTASLAESNRLLQDEIGQHQTTTDTLHSTEAQLLQSQKMEVIGTVASGVAHDFNNVLTAIIGYATLLVKEPGTRSEERATDILRVAERAATLSRQLLGFGRLQPFEPKVMAVGPALAQSESMLQRMLGDEIVLRTAAEPGVGAVLADPAQFEQLLMNLVVNARDAMPNGGRITITASHQRQVPSRPPDLLPTHDWVSVSVVDEGTGMTPEVRARIFEPFFTTKAKGHGTGLGLATCATIVERNGGWIECQSQPGRGTMFTFYLPRTNGVELARPEPARAPARAGEETILVVEDEPVVGKIVALLLEDLGYVVLSAENGLVAERIVAERGQDIDLVLTDLNMPQMNGRELLNRLRVINPDVRTILTSGEDPSWHEPEGMPLELDFLPKPFTQEVLASKIRQALDR